MAESQVAKKPSVARRALRYTWRTAKALLALVLFYAGCVLIGLIPVNNNFEPTPDGVQIFVTSNAVHADVVLPIANEVIDWREFLSGTGFPGRMDEATHVAIGWGDRGFFLETRTWGDLKASNVANALLWPSGTCLHVNFTNEKWLAPGHREVNISTAQYSKLVDFITGSFRLDETDRPQVIHDFSYTWSDGFYEAHGSYHLYNTCNCWTGGVLKAAGVCVPWFSPMPKSVFLYLPE